MSLSRAELQAMDRDELIETVVELESRVDELEAQDPLSPAEQAGLLKLLHGIAGTTDDFDVSAVEASQEAIARIDRLAEMEQRLAQLEGTVTPDPERKAYDEMDRSEKVQQLRIAAARQAKKQGGGAAMTYSEVVSLFDGHPSVGYAYTLMELAGNGDGFAYEQRDDHPNRLTVNWHGVNDDAVVHAVNNEIESGGV